MVVLLKAYRTYWPLMLDCLAAQLRASNLLKPRDITDYLIQGQLLNLRSNGVLCCFFYVDRVQHKKK